VITHSMGGLVFQSLAALDRKFVNDYVRRWVAVSCPFQGASAKLFQSFIYGYDLFLFLVPVLFTCLFLFPLLLLVLVFFSTLYF
jgi:pimeloyl-ACP methyl ester carboxylesterase